MSKLILGLVPLLVLFGAINTIRTSSSLRTQTAKPAGSRSHYQHQVLSSLHAVSLYVLGINIGWSPLPSAVAQKGQEQGS